MNKKRKEKKKNTNKLQKVICTKQNRFVVIMKSQVNLNPDVDLANLIQDSWNQRTDSTVPMVKKEGGLD